MNLTPSMILFVVFMLSLFLAIELRETLKHGIANVIRSLIGGVISPMPKRETRIEIDPKCWRKH